MMYKRVTTPASDILWGPFQLGRAGVHVTAVALVFSFIGLIFSFWPTNGDTDALTFNWSFVVYWSVLLVAVFWWFLRARHYYTGPKIELDALQH